MKRQAQYHGEIGANGKAYTKGQFIAEQEFYQGSAKKVKHTGKVEIAPCVWEVPEDEYQKSIYGFIRTVANIHTGQINYQILEYEGKDIKQVQSLVGRYLQGERWFFPNQEVYI